ncbi:response regulator transcription factor [Mitsuaria sp. WAJ17]|uniref:response regulator n=1 Tax=Mitsuaria sp. WAJ17 TaxID=2761452 RepID=UPI001C80DBD3|nr:response regulator transcription factor [Mitsuaria sp. WAJ17]
MILVDDHRLIREALRCLLARAEDIQVVGEAGEGEAAVQSVRYLKPDVVLLDISLPDLNGVEVATRILETGEDARILALSGHSDRRFVSDMLKAGAAGYVTKTAAGVDLISAIRAVSDGRTYLSADAASALASEIRDVSGKRGARLGRREREVLRLLAQGLRSMAIAEALNLSVATIEVHRRNIMRKLELHTVAELTRYAVREGIAPP